MAVDLLKIPHIVEAIRNREKQELKPLIANRTQRQEFWSATMHNDDEPMAARLKASELLARSEGDFLDRVNHSGSVDLATVIIEARNRIIRIPDNSRDPELLNKTQVEQ